MELRILCLHHLWPRSHDNEIMEKQECIGKQVSRDTDNEYATNSNWLKTTYSGGHGKESGETKTMPAIILVLNVEYQGSWGRAERTGKTTRSEWEERYPPQLFTTSRGDVSDLIPLFFFWNYDMYPRNVKWLRVTRTHVARGCRFESQCLQV